MNRFIFIIPAGKQALANAHAKALLDTRNGERSFRFGVSPTGAEPATHLIASGIFKGKQAVAEQLKLLDAGVKVITWDFRSNPGLVQSLLAEAGLQRVAPEVKPAEKEKA